MQSSEAPQATNQLSGGRSCAIAAMQVGPRAKRSASGSMSPKQMKPVKQKQKSPDVVHSMIFIMYNDSEWSMGIPKNYRYIYVPPIQGGRERFVTVTVFKKTCKT